MTEVVAALIWQGDKFMICQRPAHKARGLLWEFVGGKVEPGETKEQALIRECMEELAVTLSVVDVFMDVVHEYPDITVHLTLFNATIAEGVPQKLEHNDIKWIKPAEIPNYDFCPADIPMARKLAFAKVRHVFWDFDGTLLDSYPAMVCAFVAAAADYGIAITPERTLTLMKENLRYCCEVVGGESGVEPDALVKAFRRHEQGELQKGLPPVDGIPQVLKDLYDRGIRHYVATHRDLQCRDLLVQCGACLVSKGTQNVFGHTKPSFIPSIAKIL